ELRQRGKQVLLQYSLNLGELGPGGRISTLEDLPRGLTGARPIFLADPLYAPRPGSSERPVLRSDLAVPLVALTNPPERARHTLICRVHEPVLTLKWSRMSGTLHYRQLHMLPQDAGPASDTDVPAYYVRSLQIKPMAIRGWNRLVAKAEEI